MMAMFPMFLSLTTTRRPGDKGKAIVKTLSENEGAMKFITLRHPRPPQMILTVGIDAPHEVIDAIALEMSR